MSDQQQQMLHYSFIINGKPLIRISSAWNTGSDLCWPRNGAKSVYLVCQNTFKMQTNRSIDKCIHSKCLQDENQACCYHCGFPTFLSGFILHHCNWRENISTVYNKSQMCTVYLKFLFLTFFFSTLHCAGKLVWKSILILLPTELLSGHTVSTLKMRTNPLKGFQSLLFITFFRKFTLSSSYRSWNVYKVMSAQSSSLWIIPNNQ